MQSEQKCKYNIAALYNFANGNIVKLKEYNHFNAMRFHFITGILALSTAMASAQTVAPAPTRLTTALIEHSDRVWENGYVSSLSLADLPTAIERTQLALIRSAHPMLGWVLPSLQNGTVQTAYRIVVASSPDLLDEGKADVWDSGKVASANSSAVKMEGAALQPNTTYWWKVKTWDNYGNDSDYSAPRGFLTADVLDDAPSRYPLSITDEQPVSLSEGGLIDFGKAAFGRLRLTLDSSTGTDTVVVHLGEKSAAGKVDRKPGARIRYAAYRLPLQRGRHTYSIKLRPDRKNADRRKGNGSKVNPVYMPDYIGEVYPFRYVELENYNGKLTAADVQRQSVSYPYDDSAATFTSSDSVLNQVWELCKYTIKATSFTGTYIDGDRERIAYEGDALINQLGHYNTDREYSMARHSAEYLLANPTWPTEWNLEQVQLAWNDYLHTGDTVSLARCYDRLVPKAMLALRESNGLISTQTGKVDKAFMKSIGFRGKQVSDIVDWPQTGAAGDEKECEGEADGYVFTDYNTVVNALHYEAVRLLGEMANALGKTEDAERYAAEAEKAGKAFNALLFDKKNRRYVDGIGTDHASLHANMTALALGLVPDKQVKGVVDFVKSRGMACSVYGAQYLLAALYNAGAGDYALELLRATGKRSWWNMLRKGSTVTLEAWDEVYKPNLDWNHAWGAAPANAIPRGLFGIVPLEPGYSKFQIKPQLGTLTRAAITVPSIKGEISVNVDGDSMKVTVPVNTTAEVWVPTAKGKSTLLVDGEKVKATRNGNFLKTTLGSGNYTLTAK